MLPLFAVLATLPTVTGSYSFNVGVPGSGGIRTELALDAGGKYRYSHRGCFSDIRAEGAYSQKNGVVRLSPPKTRTGASPIPLRYHVAQYGKRTFLLKETERGSFANAVRRGDKPETLRYLAKP